MTVESSHEPPRIARAVLSVHRAPEGDDRAWGPLVVEPLPERMAAHATPPVERRRSGDSLCGGPQFARPSNRRVCMTPNATELNEREEARDCPVLLEAYRRMKRSRPSTTDTTGVKALIQRTFGAIDKGDYRPLLSGEAWLGGVLRTTEGFARLYQAFAPWVDHPMVRAILNGDPCDRELRRKRAGGPRSAFASSTSVLAAAYGAKAEIGMGPVSFERVAESRKRTRAVGGEIVCVESRSGSGSAKNLRAVERRIDAQVGIAKAKLSFAEQMALLDAAEGMPLEARLLAYRAYVMCWRPLSIKREAVRARGFEAVYRNALEADAAKIRAATSSLTDEMIQEAIKKGRKRVNHHLRELPDVGMQALVERRLELVTDEDQLLGLIPMRDGQRRDPEKAPRPIRPSFLSDD